MLNMPFILFFYGISGIQPLFFFLRFYLFEKESTSSGEGAAGCLSREPDAGLGPRTLGS